jgi:hypothetical protein
MLDNKIKVQRGYHFFYDGISSTLESSTAVEIQSGWKSHAAKK